MIMCVLLCYPVSIHIYYQQGGPFLVNGIILCTAIAWMKQTGQLQNSDRNIAGIMWCCNHLSKDTQWFSCSRNMKKIQYFCLPVTNLCDFH